MRCVCYVCDVYIMRFVLRVACWLLFDACDLMCVVRCVLVLFLCVVRKWCVFLV